MTEFDIYLVYDGRAEPGSPVGAAVLSVATNLEWARDNILIMHSGEGVIFGYKKVAAAAGEGKKLTEETYISTWRGGIRFDLSSD